MAVSVLLDLNQAVTVRDLKHFLSYVPEGFDPNRDLRMANTLDDWALLEIPLPLPMATLAELQPGQ